MQEGVLQIKRKFGKNAILKGMNPEEEERFTLLPVRTRDILTVSVNEKKRSRAALLYFFFTEYRSQTAPLS